MSASQGVSVEVGERETAIDLTVIIEYGESIPQVAGQIRENVITTYRGDHWACRVRGQRRGQRPPFPG